MTPESVENILMMGALVAAMLIGTLAINGKINLKFWKGKKKEDSD